ncbi:MAG: rod shape-determining protein MreC [Clostridia bacterium]|nr:rod shape-determining protein MreC [Clostridia bacterium]
MKHFMKSTGFKVLICILAFLIGMLGYAAATDFNSVTGTLLSPFQSLTSSLSTGIHNLFDSSNSKKSLEEENAKLKDQINALRKSQVELDELRRQNTLYKDFLGLKEENPDYVFKDARVIAVDPVDIYHNFTINRGTMHDVKKGNVVITPDGLVGVVYETGINYAKVRTILDPELQISCYDSRTREDGISTNDLENAKQEQFKLSQMSRDATAATGDTVVTYGGIYPTGLLIGEIIQVKADTDGLSKYALVKPFADISAVSEVFVITSFKEGD